ncbi:MAG: hypothetical protein R3E39_07080 [Anaerolineae bacterium]
MSISPLPPDENSRIDWEKLPQNTPSSDALPPVDAGIRWVRWLLILTAFIIIFGLLQGGSG